MLDFLYARLLKVIHGNSFLLGKRCRIDHGSKIYITADGRVEIGDDVTLRSSPRGYHGGMPFPCTILIDRDGGVVRIGESSRINGAYIHAQLGISIGQNCVIAAGVNIIDSNGHEVVSANRTVGRDEPLPIEIGDNVWIGLNAIILKGARIGKNSVIGANSVVSGVFPDNSLIVGNPARVVKTIEIPAPRRPNEHMVTR